MDPDDPGPLTKTMIRLEKTAALPPSMVCGQWSMVRRRWSVVLAGCGKTRSENARRMPGADESMEWIG
jgi:hypothetical protein